MNDEVALSDKGKRRGKMGKRGTNKREGRWKRGVRTDEGDCYIAWVSKNKERERLGWKRLNCRVVGEFGKESLDCKFVRDRRR